jgi:hypothetical protein
MTGVHACNRIRTVTLVVFEIVVLVHACVEIPVVFNRRLDT